MGQHGRRRLWAASRDVVLVRYPFSDLTTTKVRPAVVVGAPHPSDDLLIVPLTSRVTGLLPGEFLPTDWQAVGLNVPSAVKRGVFTIHERFVIKTVGQLGNVSTDQMDTALRTWLGLA